MEELRVVLKDVHPHFCAEKYLGFLIARQSCDLVRRRGGTVKARHISIAVIRSLKAVLPRLLEEVARPVAPGMFLASAKLDARRFLERLFDQNEQGIGLFYLHPDADIGLGEPSVAFLRIKVALRAQHYDVLMRARKGRLGPEFRGKLGWLLGNLYSRAASPDWSDVEGGKKQVQQLIDKHLVEQFPGAGPVWIDDALVEAAKSVGVVFEKRDPNELLNELEKHRPKARIDQIVEHAVAEVSRVLNPSEDQVRLLKNKLLNSGALRKLAR
jgi:hypothetical protein